MPAVLRIDSWDFPLFLHVLGATLLFGGMLTTTALALVGRSSQHAALLARYAFRTLLFVVVPSWVLTRIAAEWILSREKELIPGLDDKGWVGTGFIVTDAGAVLIIVLGVLAFLSARKGGTGRLGTFVAALSVIYVIALGVAWFAMSAKPGA